MPINIAQSTWRAVPYQRNQALRASARQADLQSDYLERGLEHYDEDRALAIGEARRRREIADAQEQRAADAHDRQAQAAQAEMGVRSAWAGWDAYARAEGTEEERRAAGAKAAEASLDNDLPGGIQEVYDYLQEQNPDWTPGAFDPEGARGVLAPFMQQQQIDPSTYAAKENWTDDDGIARIGYWQNTPLGPEYVRTDIPAVQPGAGSGDGTKNEQFSPPSQMEFEAALAAVKADDLLGNLESKEEKERAALDAATRARQIMKDSRGDVDWNTALATALSQIKRDVLHELDTATGADTKYPLRAKGLADNEFRGTDGVLYVRGQDGSWRRKD